MIRFLLFIFLFFNIINVSSQNIEFYREDLTFKIEKNYFSVDGLYYFCNVTDKNQKINILYPFPADSTYGNIDSIFVLLNDSIPIEFYKKENKGIFFYIKVNKYGTTKYRIKYRQKIKANKAEYILITTQSWKKPFEIVNYKLIVSNNIKITDISYKTDSIKNSATNTFYYWQKKDFMPDKNMIIKFEDNK